VPKKAIWTPEVRARQCTYIADGCQVLFALLASLSNANVAIELSGKYTQVDRQMVSSLIILASRPCAILRTFAWVFGFTEAKNTALGAMGNTIKQEGSFSGIPHG
jgi:hypothetical protein